jgi:phosphatidylserine/phosphatidylglycerophosphate/cardiolipin synthase-like enzyme
VIERLTTAHHARRLGKLGRSAQCTPPDDGRVWAAGDPSPRAGNRLDVLIGGAAYFAALEQAIREARRSVLIAGWCITPGFALVRDEPPVLLRELLREAAESVDVRVLLWAGAPVPVFAPRRASVREGRDELVRGTRIEAALDSNERPMHCHHEKLVVIDDEVAFVGGIDLTDLNGDRYDTPDHPARGRMGWHDVASRLRGPAVADVGRHVAARWQAVTGERLTTIRARSGNTSDRVYVHAKVGIVDDRWLTLGSANLNAHSFFNDSEVNVVTCDAALARDTRLRLWAAHLERAIDEVDGDPSIVVDELWRPIAAEQRERRDRDEPLTHGLVQLQATSRRSERLLGPLQALLVDG